MSLVTTKEMFEKAYNGGYAVGAFNVNNMEIVLGITEAAKEENAPLILQVSKGARKYANHTYLIKLVEAAIVCNPDLPIALHLDHGPDFETCKAILESKINNSPLELSNFDPEVINYFATRFGGSVRELEGAFAKLVFYAQNFTNSKHIDLQTAIESVKGLTSSISPEENLNEERIISCVADYYSLTPNQITGSSRIANIALARHIAMYLIRTMLDTPFTKMGAKFGGKDHSTVMTAVSKIEDALKTDEQLKIAIKELKKRING